MGCHRRILYIRIVFFLSSTVTLASDEPSAAFPSLPRAAFCSCIHRRQAALARCSGRVGLQCSRRQDPFMQIIKPEVTGYEWVTTTMNRPKACYKMFRLRRPIFDNLHEALTRNYGLQSTTGMSSIECLAMFLWIVGGPQSIRQVENRFERSTETINRKFNHVLNYLNRLAVDNIKPKDP
jgi:hypothetical protein